VYPTQHSIKKKKRKKERKKEKENWELQDKKNCFYEAF
jgi:hypothetical protein